MAIGQILEGQAYCFGRVTSHISIVMREATAPAPPKCPPLTEISDQNIKATIEIFPIDNRRTVLRSQ